jgi:hypothetical protein
MRCCYLLLGVFGAIGTIGCASWQQPIQNSPDVRTWSDPSTPVIIASQTDRSSSPKTEINDPAPVVLVENTAAEKKDTETSARLSDDPLTIVAESLDRGDKSTAATHLEIYVRQHPDQVMFRLQLAELLIQIDRDTKAKIHYEQFASDAQTAKGSVRDYLVHAHTRLMEIGQRAGDQFAELFHRGVGFLILVQEQDRNPDRDVDFCEEMLCKSLRAFNEARELRPEDPRVRVYLAEVYELMGNRRGAAAERAAARNRNLPDQLSPGERALILVRGS